MSTQYKILDKIDSPAELKKLDPDNLPLLAQEIRNLIINTVAENGGHLATNLGAVELTIALHRVFTAPYDKIIFDVGHQCYTHKILTGRRNDFATLRLAGGISGFTNKNESEYDCFTTGHASNSISLALGMAQARDLNHDDYDVVAVIGDGALTGGMALEAINHAGFIKGRLIIVLNDNEMSIAKNVGALSKHLLKFRTNASYNKAKMDVESLLSHIPLVGNGMKNGLRRFKDSFKYALLPGTVFEEFGYVYLGPIDGHDIASLENIFERARNIRNKPVVIHVHTKKGYGYLPAEMKPHLYHGVSHFDPRHGIDENKPDNSFSAAFGNALCELAAEDNDIVAITAAMADGTGLSKFRKLYPQRFYDVGIAEQHAVSFAAGLASMGKKPVAAIYSSFLQRAYDQIIEDVCLQQLPVVLAIDRAGIVGEDGLSHNGIYDISYLRSIPHLTLISPKDGQELALMLKQAFAWCRPVAIRYPRGNTPVLPLSCAPIEYGKAEKLRDGTELTIIAAGSLAYIAMQTAALLNDQGIAATVYNARFLNHPDEAMLENGSTSGRMVFLEENICSGGFFSACLEVMVAKGWHADTLSVALPCEFINHGKTQDILSAYDIDSQRLAVKIKDRWFSDLPSSR